MVRKGGLGVKKLGEWMAEPLVLPRWMLYALYLLFVTLGIILAMAGTADIPDSPEEFQPYGIAITVSAGIALVASAVRHRAGIDPSTVWWRAVESFADLCLFALLSAYIIAAVDRWFHGDLDRGALAIIVTIASLIPLFRWIVLGKQLVTYWANR